MSASSPPPQQAVEALPRPRGVASEPALAYRVVRFTQLLTLSHSGQDPRHMDHGHAAAAHARQGRLLAQPRRLIAVRFDCEFASNAAADMRRGRPDSACAYNGPHLRWELPDKCSSSCFHCGLSRHAARVCFVSGRYDFVAYALDVPEEWRPPLQVPRLVFLLGIVTRLFKAWGAHNPSVQQDLLELVMLVLWFLHGSACLWLWIARTNKGEMTWASSGRRAEDTVQQHYLYSFYYAVAIMSSCGFGDIVPTTAVERLLSCFLMWIGSIIYSFMLGSFAALMQARTVSLILLC